MYAKLSKWLENKRISGQDELAYKPIGKTSLGRQ
jgi:hypothetical protein